MWLVKDIQTAATVGSLLRHFLGQTPEMVEFLNAAPQVRRLLNPICRMLGVNLEAPLGPRLPLTPLPLRPKPARRKPEPAEVPPRAPEPPRPSRPLLAKRRHENFDWLFQRKIFSSP